ncbi:putative cyclin [Helianthus annuus]|nr:putative cyclin domain-containing protein [Helianthus annuus]KAJ0811734.1 putative cyclin [Helianthus annuus]
MHRSSSRQRDMDIENVPAANIQGPPGRVTRARAKVFGASAGLPPLQPVVKQDHKRAPLTVVAPMVQAKKRAVLKDITNNSFNESSIKVPNGNKAQISKRVKRCAVKKNEKVARSIPVDLQIQKRNIKAAETVTKQSANELCEANSQLTSENDITISVGESIITVEVEATNDESVIDIDSKHKGPQMCSLYAAEIHANLCTNELKWRHSADYMKTVQLEITQEMRSILIDWLVEVCEEYGLASETFYLTVALIDIYLSKKCIGKRRLQLLGITCMLVASKYEEICAPRVEEFCFITDSTYTRADVLEMEHQILDVLSFQLSVPTIKKFLRRFLLAAQSSYKAPVIELEFLANYLAELSQIEYRFIKFLPSLIAASAVYLAKWTLDQDEDPWNATLEHYTSYKAPELKVTVLALQDLQLNNASPLHAIRQKYKQQKYKSVATLISQKPVKPLF